MSDEIRDDEMREESADETDRRAFLRQAGMIGGGALAALAGLAAAADAQDIRTFPRTRMGDRGLLLPAIQEQAASADQFARAFARLREMGATEKPDERWAEAMGEMSPSSRAAGALLLELRQRFKDSRDVGNNLVILFSLLASGMRQLQDQGIDPHALGNSCGNGCGNNCGNACLSPVAAGFICGNGCGGNCSAMTAAGLACGGGCEDAGLRQLTFDREGMVVDEIKMNMPTVAAAMRNADRAYNEVFG